MSTHTNLGGALLAYVDFHGSPAATRDQIVNVLALAETDDVRPDLVAHVFGIIQKALKRLGDKRLVWRAAALSLTAAGRENRQEQDAKEEALTLICGRSWVLQRVDQLDEARGPASAGSITLSDFPVRGKFRKLRLDILRRWFGDRWRFGHRRRCVGVVGRHSQYLT